MTDNSTSNFLASAAPIVRQKLSDQVYEQLWSMISTGELAAGDALPSERALMDRFGVGRPAIREALQALSNKGVLSITQGELSRVKELGPAAAFEQVDAIAKLLLSSQPGNLDHLKQLRKMLEASIVMVAAENGTDQDVQDLREIVEKQRRHLDDAKAFTLSDIAFHVRIAGITGNPLLQAITQAMLTWLSEYYAPLLHWSGRENTTLLEHESIIKHLENRDAQGANRMMRDHLNRSDPLYSNEAR